jgi:hypothetical protein
MIFEGLLECLKNNKHLTPRLVTELVVEDLIHRDEGRL